LFNVIKSNALKTRIKLQYIKRSIQEN